MLRKHVSQFIFFGYVFLRQKVISGHSSLPGVNILVSHYLLNFTLRRIAQRDSQSFLSETSYRGFTVRATGTGAERGTSQGHRLTKKRCENGEASGQKAF